MFAVFRADLGKANQPSIITQIGDKTDNAAQKFASIGFISASGNGNPGFITGTDADTSWVKNTTISDQTDYIVGALVDFVTPATVGPTSVKLYVDNVLIDTLSTTTPSFSSNGGIRLMRRWDLGDYWGGYLATVDIYNAALSNSEITSIWNTTKSRFGL